LEKSIRTHTLHSVPGPRSRAADRSTRWQATPLGNGAAHKETGAAPGGRAAPAEVDWWRWGRIELPVQNTFPENFLQVFPANLRFAVRAPDRRGASLAIR